jgi:hypothetical protein
MVRSDYISPEETLNFINHHMSNFNQPDSKNTEDTTSRRQLLNNLYNKPSKVSNHLSVSEISLLCPKFFLKILNNFGRVEIKLFYTVEALMQEVIQLWGSKNMIIQPFIKQKHPLKPAIL